MFTELEPGLTPQTKVSAPNDAPTPFGQPAISQAADVELFKGDDAPVAPSMVLPVMTGLLQVPETTPVRVVSGLA